MTRFSVGTNDRIWPTYHRKLARVVERVNMLINQGQEEVHIADKVSGRRVTVTDIVVGSQLQELLHTEDWRTK